MKRLILFLLEWLKNITNPAISFFARVEHSSIAKNARIYRNAKVIKSSVGDYSYIAPNTTVLFAEIGKFCSIGQNCNIGLAKHPIDFISTSPIFISPHNATGSKWVNDIVYDEFASVSIGNDVWIGNNVSIMGGISIGNGAIIGTGAVVTKNIEPYAIVGGVPAKTIKYRFDDNTITKLQKSEWWNLPNQELKKLIKSFQSSNFDIEQLTND